ncbi:MAG: Nudix family hydrolase [Burkholderiaceae bacterium]|nr:Nudix family hydrolase [Burkholderiaceae bacterium]
MTLRRALVDVAAGVLLRSDGRVLLANRPVGKPYASYWEFPGGKVEPGESIAAALARELHEELAISIGTPHPWIVRVFDYPHALVRLHFFRVFAWRGELRAREHQDFGFFSPDMLPAGPLLPATVPVLRWLDLPLLYAISAVASIGRDRYLERLESALEHGLRLLQFREPSLTPADAASVFAEVLARVRGAGATLLVNSRHEPRLWDQADGVHLTAVDAARTRHRPDHAWVTASAHSSAEIEHAAALDVDAVLVGSVEPTTTHPDRSPLGWSAFTDLVSSSPLPAYALGGMKLGDVTHAVRRGAHGIASISGVWGEDQCLPGASLDDASLASELFSSEAAIE